MTIKCLTGDKSYKGSLITLNDVRIEKLPGLSFDYGANNISTFDLAFSYLDFTFTPGALGKAAGFMGALEKIVS